MSRFRVEVREWQDIVVDESELMTLTEAAGWLGLEHVNTLANLVERGRLRRVWDMDEPNPVKRTRVFAADVERELARRRERKDDGRLRRPAGGG